MRQDLRVGEGRLGFGARLILGPKMGRRPGSYTFEQDENTVTMFVFVPKGTRGKDLAVRYPTTTSIEVTLSGVLIVKGALGGAVRRDECTWSVDGDELRITLAKTVETVSEETGWKVVVEGTQWHTEGAAPEADADVGESAAETLLLRFVLAVALAHVAFATRRALPETGTFGAYAWWTLAVVREELEALLVRPWPTSLVGGALAAARLGVSGGMVALLMGWLQMPWQWLAVHGAGALFNAACAALGAPYAGGWRLHAGLAAANVLAVGAGWLFVHVRLGRLREEHAAAVRKMR